jgi:hypothetical protein
MKRTNIDIAIGILDTLQDAEYHTITATTLKVAKYFHFTKNEMNEIYGSRNISSTTISNTKIYTQVQLLISSLRKAKYVKDFPGTKNKGIFIITDKGLKLIPLTPTEIKKQISEEIKKYTK